MYLFFSARHKKTGVVAPLAAAGSNGGHTPGACMGFGEAGKNLNLSLKSVVY